MRIPSSLLCLVLSLSVAGFAACSKDSTPATADDAGTSPKASSTTSSTAVTTASTPSATPTDSSLAMSADAATTPSASATTSASALASATNAGDSGAGATCGKRPLPDCPLQAWMKANTGGAMQAKNFPALASALTNTAAFAPPGYSTWASISNDGAKAATAQDMDGVKASCRNCHTQYKQRYITEMRARKI